MKYRKMKDQSFFLPEGAYFSKCNICGLPSVQFFSNPDSPCIWCAIYCDPKKRKD